MVSNCELETFNLTFPRFPDDDHLLPTIMHGVTFLGIALAVAGSVTAGLGADTKPHIVRIRTCGYRHQSCVCPLCCVLSVHDTWCSIRRDVTLHAHHACSTNDLPVARISLTVMTLSVRQGVYTHCFIHGGCEDSISDMNSLFVCSSLTLICIRRLSVTDCV